jgi:8-oxo-dGTP pyrophosphatase MutT (NUDIX family)
VPRRSEPFRPEAPIVAELASGAIVSDGTHRSILLLHERQEDRWGFAKGHVDPGESLTQAALREIREETGLAQVHLEEELGEVSYRFFDPKRGLNVHKTTVFFLGTTDERALTLEPMFDRAEWVDLATARARVPFETDRAMLARFEARVGAASRR